MIDTDKMCGEFPVFGVCGVSDTGKTALLCDLVEELTERGYDIATIKHTRGEFSIDEEGKDTWRHSEAGAELVVFSTAEETDFLVKKDLDLEEIMSGIEKIGCYDAVLIEGMKEADIPKIDLNGDKNEMEFDVQNLADKLEKKIEINDILNSLPEKDCKRCGYESCKELASAIWEKKETLDSCEYLEEEKGGRVELLIDGEEVSLGRFPSQLIESTMKGMMSSLKGVEEMGEIKEIELKISEEEKR